MPPALRFRLRAFGWHLLGSAAVLALVLGALYLGWYRWPGWYLTKALGVAPILAGVDVALGPLVTLLIASPRKPRRALARDIAIIVAVQLAALLYGASTLWQGRPLYYAFSEDRLQIVQAADLAPRECALALQQHSAFAPQSESCAQVLQLLFLHDPPAPQSTSAQQAPSWHLPSQQTPAAPH